jgi:Family of unknown function (DUF6113)
VKPVAQAAPIRPPYNLHCVETRRVRGADAFTVGSAYVALFLLGLVEGVIGCFQFSRGAGPVPLAALAFCAAIFGTCLLAARGMGSPLGGLVPALGWFVAALVLSMPTAGGSVIVTSTAAGKWFLYGGAIGAGLGMALSFRGRQRR